MTMENFSTYQLISDFNRSAFRRSSIPHNLYSGWPCLQKAGKALCITIPYYSRTATSENIHLYPLYCSVTIPVKNPDRIVDFTIYPLQRTWGDVDYEKPCGTFKHAALDDVKTKGEYQELCKKLFGYYDKMIAAVLNKEPFAEEAEMTQLLSKLMEPGQYPQYLRLNKKFYSHFCNL